MSRDSLNIPKAERWKMHCGMTPSDCKALVAVLSHYNVTRKPVTGPQVAKFLLQLGELRNAALGNLERRGWIRAVGVGTNAAAHEHRDTRTLQTADIRSWDLRRSRPRRREGEGRWTDAKTAAPNGTCTVQPTTCTRPASSTGARDAELRFSRRLARAKSTNAELRRLPNRALTLPATETKRKNDHQTIRT